MCIRLEEIRSYSKEIVDFIKSHQDAYNGGEGLEENLPVSSNIKLFNLIKNDIAIGFLMLVDCMDEPEFPGHELEIGIFENFQNSSYATYCIANIEKLLSKHAENIDKIIVQVKETNNDSIKIKKVLVKNGFTYYEDNIFGKCIRKRS